MKTKIILSLTGILVSLFTPLAVLVPRASAILADTCVWTGLGTGTEDAAAKTWTYEASDPLNWSGCDNGTVPESGDTLEFPANLTTITPSDPLLNNSMGDWKYVVNNGFVGMDFAGINFTGDTGTDCTVYNDMYTIAGNDITLSGDVSNSATGNCVSQYGHFSVLDLSITTSADISLTVDLQDTVAPITGNTLTFGANTLSFCDVLDANRADRYPNIYTKLTGTGVLTIACQANWSPTTLDTFGDVVVESNTYFSGSIVAMGASATRTYTFKSGAQFNFYESLGKVEEFKSNIVFVGAGTTSGYCKSYACSGADYVSVPGLRGSFSNYKWDPVAKKSTYYGVNFTGDMTLSADTIFNGNSDLTISGAISGAFKIGALTGSRGKVILQSTSNQSSTPNGTIEPARYDYALTDQGYDLTVNYGQDAVLKSTEEILFLVTVQDGGKLKGVGKVKGIDVLTGGTLAPGNSPGCIVSNGDLTLSGSYDVEIAGTTACTEHDQTDVTGAVDVTDGTLNTTILNSFVPKLNDTFVIIKNDAADAVTGTFAGLVEGASIEKTGVTYQISYKGGDGNDVVLTATAIPAAVTTPDTGIGQIMQSPITTLLAVMLSAGALLAIKRIQSAK